MSPPKVLARQGCSETTKSKHEIATHCAQLGLLLAREPVNEYPGSVVHVLGRWSGRSDKSILRVHFSRLDAKRRSQGFEHQSLRIW